HCQRRLLQLLALNPPRYGNPDRVLLPNVPAEVGKYSRCRPDAWQTKANQGRARFGGLAKKVPYSTFREDGMTIIRWTRRDVLKAASGAVAAGVFTSSMRAQAQQVKYSQGAEPPKLKAPPNATDCHHHIYDARYPADPTATLRPPDALVEDYRALQRRIGTSRNVLVQPSTYGIDNRCHLEALATFGPSARMVAVVNDTVSTEELKRMHALGVRGIRFNLAQAGATTPEMLEPLSKRINELGWHIQINAPAAKILEIMPI